MNQNLFINEVRRNVLSLLLWLIIITVLIAVTMSAYRTFVANQSKIMGMLSIIPRGLLQFKGVSDFNDLFSALGFYAVNNVIYMMVLGSIYSIVLSSNILLKEEYQKTAEYLLTRPLTRTDVFLSKLIVVFLFVLLLNLFTSSAGLLCVVLTSDGLFSVSAFLILSFYTFLLNLLFAAIGLFISVSVKKPKPVTTFCIGLVMILYFIFTISRITEKMVRIGYISPFSYVDTKVTDPGYSLNPANLSLFGGITLLLLFISYLLYLKRDIYT